MKPTKTQIRILRSFLSGGGCVATSDWTTGSHRYTTRRCVPLHCSSMDINAACLLPGLSGLLARRMRRDRPRVQRIIVVTNRHRATRLINCDPLAIERRGDITFRVFTDAHGNYELWTGGVRQAPSPFTCGYVSAPEYITEGVDAWLEEAAVLAESLEWRAAQ